MRLKKIKAEDITERIETERVMYNADPSYDVWEVAVKPIIKMLNEYIKQSQKFKDYCKRTGANPDANFADVGSLFDFHSDYNMIWGQRSNGKTSAIIMACTVYHAITGKGTAIIKRYDKGFEKKAKGVKLYSILNDYDLVKIIYNGEWEKVEYLSTYEWYLTREHDNNEKIKSPSPIFIGFALNKQDDDRGGGETDKLYDNIFFDEFIPMSKRTMPNETTLFFQVISTIIRSKANAKVFMSANANDFFSPYFDIFGVNPDEVEIGKPTIYRLEADEEMEKGSIAVLRTEPDEISKMKNAKFFNVNDPNVRAILSGDFQMILSPRVPMNHKEMVESLRFTFYIYISRSPLIPRDEERVTDRYIFKAEVHKNKEFNFIYIEPIDVEYFDETKLIYSNRYEGRRNWVRGVKKPFTDIQKRITKYFVSDNVFFSDDKTSTIIKDKLLSI